MGHVSPSSVPHSQTCPQSKGCAHAQPPHWRGASHPACPCWQQSQCPRPSCPHSLQHWSSHRSPQECERRRLQSWTSDSHSWTHSPSAAKCKQGPHGGTFGDGGREHCILVCTLLLKACCARLVPALDGAGWEQRSAPARPALTLPCSSSPSALGECGGWMHSSGPGWSGETAFCLQLCVLPQ